jgi:hypothetical protein
MISIVDDDESVREATKCLVRSLGVHRRGRNNAAKFCKWLRDPSLPPVVCPCARPICSPSIRARMSTAPLGGAGTTNLDCARRLRRCSVAGQRDRKNSDSRSQPCQMQNSTARIGRLAVIGGGDEDHGAVLWQSADMVVERPDGRGESASS